MKVQPKFKKKVLRKLKINTPLQTNSWNSHGSKQIIQKLFKISLKKNDKKIGISKHAYFVITLVASSV